MVWSSVSKADQGSEGHRALGSRAESSVLRFKKPTLSLCAPSSDPAHSQPSRGGKSWCTESALVMLQGPHAPAPHRERDAFFFFERASVDFDSNPDVCWFAGAGRASARSCVEPLERGHIMSAVRVSFFEWSCRNISVVLCVPQRLIEVADFVCTCEWVGVGITL